MKNNILAIVAGLVGGIIGFYCFFWIKSQGFYALVLPGGLIGLGASIFKPKSKLVCVMCGCMALAIGLLTEWRAYPFIKDKSLVFFLANIHQLQPMTLILIGIGTVLGFGIPWNHTRPVASSQ